MTMTKEEELAKDYDRAKRHAEFYIEYLQNQIISRGMILNGAIEEYNKWRDLPESSNLASAIWDAAFGALSLAVPLLRVAPFLKKHYEVAVAVIEATEAIGQKAKRKDKAKRVGTKAALKIGDLAKLTDDVKALVDKIGKVSPTAQEMIKHASRKPIFELLKDLADGTTLWKTGKDAVALEWENRLDDIWPEKGKEETLEAMAKRLLPDLPETYAPEDLNEIWTLYLYYLIGQHIHMNVKVVTSNTTYIYDQGRPNQDFSDTKIEGINNNQWTQIYAWFGPGVRRKTKFLAPNIKSRLEFVYRHRPTIETKKKMVDNGSWRRAKM